MIVLVQRIPAGCFRAKSNVPVQYMDMLVLRKMDKVAYRLAQEMERAGHPTFVTAAQETDWNYKRASYGRLSTRHLGVEAGLGTLGLEVNILTPEFGPRVYLTGILTELELEPDQRITEQVCIGESCSRCLHSCPPNAVLHWGIDKRACATEAQEFGFMTMLQFMERVIDAPASKKSEMLKTRRPVRLLAGPAARGRLVRRLPALPRGLPGGQRLPRAPRRGAEVHPREDAGEGRPASEIQERPQVGRRPARPVEVERALGRRGRLQGHGREAAAGVQEAPAWK